MAARRRESCARKGVSAWRRRWQVLAGERGASGPCQIFNPFAEEEGMRTMALIVTLFALAAAGRAVAADPNLGRDLAATCANCHGTDGRAQGEFTRLAGMPASQMLSKLGEFRDGSRQATIMHQIVKGFTDEQLKAIADYFAKQK
jgi:cytochrome subunit of sulfide dehydrogenase